MFIGQIVYYFDGPESAPKLAHVVEFDRGVLTVDVHTSNGFHRIVDAQPRDTLTGIGVDSGSPWADRFTFDHSEVQALIERKINGALATQRNLLEAFVVGAVRRELEARALGIHEDQRGAPGTFVRVEGTVFPGQTLTLPPQVKVQRVVEGEPGSYVDDNRPLAPGEAASLPMVEGVPTSDGGTDPTP